MPDLENGKFLNFVEKYVGGFGRILGWLWLLIASVVLSNLIGVFLFDYLGQGVAGGIIWITFAVLGLVIGIIWAEHVRRKIGFLKFFSKLQASPDFDGKRSDKDEENGKS